MELKRWVRSAIFLSTVLFFAPAANAQWVPTNGPGGVPIYAIASRGNDVFAQSSGGTFYRTTNGGRLWTMVGAIVIDNRTDVFLSFAVSGNNLFVGTADEGAFISTNSGVTWPHLVIDTSQRNMSAVSIVTVNNGVLLASTDVGNYRSIDHGATWARADSAVSIDAVSVSGDTLYADRHGVICRSTNNGVSWTKRDSLSGIAHDYIIAVLFADGYLYAVSHSSDMFRSIDSGMTWAKANKGLPNSFSWQQTSLAVHNGGVYVGTATGLYRTTNHGDEWIRVDDGFCDQLSGVNNMFVAALAVINDKIYAGTSGIYVSSDDGATWSPSSTGLISVNANSFSSSGDTLFVSAGNSNDGAFVTTDFGNRWYAIDNGLSTHYTSSIFTNNGVQFLGAGTGISAMYRSTNGGVSWDNESNGLPLSPFFSAISYFAVDSAIFVCTSPFGLFVTTNNGNEWNASGNGITSSHVFSIAMNHDTMFVGTESGVFRSTNKGSLWTAANNGLSDLHVAAMAFCGNALFATTQNGVYRTVDGGSSWARTSEGLTNDSLYTLAVYKNALFTGSRSGGVFASTDMGEHWTAVNDGLPYQFVYALLVSGGYLFTSAMTGNDGGGVWRRPLSEMVTGVDQQHDISPSHVSLCQNHPNPFTDETTIEFTLPSRSEVSLTFFDALGQQVARPIKLTLGAGVQKQTFNGEELKSGIYFFRLTAGAASRLGTMNVVH